MFTDNQIQVLAILTNHPSRDYYLSELGAILKKHPGTFQRGINSLEKQGFIISHKRGNQRLFRINAEHPMFPEIKGIARKAKGAEGLLAEAVKNINGVSAALIYGSYVSGRMRPDSDIDVLIITDDPGAEDAFLGKIGLIENKLSREVNYKIYAMKEFKEKRKNKDPFLEEVLTDKYILLKGKI